MVFFIVFDVSLVLGFAILGICLAGATIKELADFLVEKIHLVYPAFMATLVVCLAIYYIGHKIYVRNDSAFDKSYSDRVAFNRVVCFAINSPFAVFCPIAMIRTLAYFISTMGFGGFIIAFSTLF